MAIAFDSASVSDELSGQSSRVWAHTIGVGSNRLLQVGTMVRDTTNTVGLGAATAVTFGSASLDLVEEHEPTDSDIGYVTVQLWELRNPAVGTDDIEVTWAGGIARGGCGAVSLTGVDLSDPYEGSPVVADSNFDFSSAPELSIAATAAGQWLLDVVYNMASSQATTESGQTARVNEVYGSGSFNDNGGMSTREASGAGSLDMGWTHPDDGYWAQLAVVLRPAVDELGLDVDPGDFRISGGAVNLRALRLLNVDAAEIQFSGGDTLGRITRRLSVDAADFRFQGGAVGLPLRRTLRAEAGVLAFSGGAVSLRYHHRMPIDAGEYRIEGQPVTFHRGYRVAAEAGDFRFLGGAIGFRVNHRIGADAGELRFAGGDVDMAVFTDGTLNVDAGDFRIEGAVMSLRASRRLSVAAGDLRFEGAEVRALAARRLHVEPGDFRINGMPVNLIAETSITLGADAGVFGIVGSAVSLRLVRHLSVGAGELTFAGGEVDLTRDRVLKIAPGHFRISGGRARLIYSGAPPATGADRGGVTSGVTESIIERIAAA